MAPCMIWYDFMILYVIDPVVTLLYPSARFCTFWLKFGNFASSALSLFGNIWRHTKKYTETYRINIIQIIILQIFFVKTERRKDVER